MKKFELKQNFRNNYSGKTLRNFRQTLAQIANKKSSDSILTIKFKLDCSKTGKLPKYENLISLYDTIEDIKKGIYLRIMIFIISSKFNLI